MTGPVVIAVDEHIERRGGRKIKAIGCYTESDSKVGFWLRWLCNKFIAFTRALCLHYGRSLQAKNLCNRLAKFPTFESLSVYRDAVRSSQKHIVKCFGLKWITVMILKQYSWIPRLLALPFLTILAPSEKANKKAAKRHKTRRSRRQCHRQSLLKYKR